MTLCAGAARFLLRFCCWALFLPAAFAARQLRRLVVVGRHSLKNPYPAPGAPLEAGVAGAPLSAYTGRELPQFPVAPGELTPRGKELMYLLGAYHRERYSELLQSTSCQQIAVHADPTSPRDMDSAEAFARAFIGPSGCTPGVNRNVERQRLQRIFRDTPDGWDAARGCGTPRVEELGVLLGLDSTGHMPASWLRVYRQQLGKVQDVTRCCSQEACAGVGEGAGLCTIFNLPLRIAPNVTWRAIGGTLGVASAFAEIFAMQWCEGLEAGWGLREEDVVELLSLLEVPFNRAGTNEVSARNLGSDLLDELLAALDPARPSSAPAIAMYFGHDTNIQFLRQLLRLEWLSEGWWPNGAEPGSQILFELYDEDPGVNSATAKSVKLLKLAASPGQQRSKAALTKVAPPSVVPVWIPGCGGLHCPLPKFLALARAALRPECVQAPSTTAANRTAVASGAAGASTTGAGLAGAAATTGVRAIGDPWLEPRASPGLLEGSSPPAPEPVTANAAAIVGAQPVLPGPPREAADANGAGPASGPVLLLILAVAGYLGWRYLQKRRAAERGYETLGSSGGGRLGGRSGGRSSGPIGVPDFIL